MPLLTSTTRCNLVIVERSRSEQFQCFYFVLSCSYTWTIVGQPKYENQLLLTIFSVDVILFGHSCRQFSITIFSHWIRCLPDETVENYLVLQKYERENFETHVNSQEFERKVKRKINERKSRVIGQGETKWLHFLGEYVDLHSGLLRDRNWCAQQS